MLPSAKGKHLIAAKADVQRGEWLPMLQEVGIDQSTARRLMSIGGNPAIANRGNCHDFPAALRSLYELSRLDPEAIESGIEHGDIHPGMTTKSSRSATGEVIQSSERVKAHAPATPHRRVTNRMPRTPAMTGPRYADPLPHPFPPHSSHWDILCERTRGRSDIRPLSGV